MDVQAKELETELDAALIDVEDQIAEESCKDHDVNCTSPGKLLYENNPNISLSVSAPCSYAPQFSAKQCNVLRTMCTAGCSAGVAGLCRKGAARGPTLGSVTTTQAS